MIQAESRSRKANSMNRESGENKKKSVRQPKMREVRRRAVNVMCPKVTKIARTLAKMAEEGNCQAAKLVFEFLGIFPAAHAEDEEGDDTLARYLLRELGIPDHPTEEEITKVLQTGKEANAGAVESS